MDEFIDRMKRECADLEGRGLRRRLSSSLVFERFSGLGELLAFLVGDLGKLQAHRRDRASEDVG